MAEKQVKVITVATVVLIASTAADYEGVDQVLLDAEAPQWDTDTTNDSERLIELAGRTCYQSFKAPRPGGNKEYVRHVLEVGHGSVIEHASWTFLFAGVSRSLTHELVRHRAGMAYSQLSQRFVDESKRASCVVPAAVAADPLAMSIWEESVNASHQSYLKLVDRLLELSCPPHENGRVFISTDMRKAARGAARSVLPNAAETKIVVTGNARSWRHFLEQRCSQFADKEIRDVAFQVYGVLVVEAPNLFGDYEVTPHVAEGGFSLSTPYKKV